MRRRTAQIALFGTALLAGALAGVRAQPGPQNDSRTYLDTAGNAVLRRTDSCNCGVLLPSQTLPDVERIVISPWEAFSPGTDPYTGVVEDRFGAHLVRLDVVFVGLVNPPGPLGLSSPEYNPFKYGASPAYGFVEIDVDNDRETGGDQPDPATNHYLGNAARFGCRPAGTIGARAARSADDLFQPWNHSPQVCLSGSDWVLALCGCFPVSVVHKNNPADTTFGAGDTWIVEGRFFQRASAYQHASTMTGGTAPGMYDPVVRLQFHHCTQTNRTTVSLVYGLDNVGAWLLAGGQPAGGPEPMDHSAANATSIAEGAQDLIEAASRTPNTLTGLEYQVTHHWSARSIFNAIDTTRWRPTYIVGTAYAAPADSLYVWTDLGFGCTRGDVTGDGQVTTIDRQAVAGYIADEDGGPNDADNAVNGRVLLASFGTNFVLYDVDSSGEVEPGDQPTPVCPGDFDRSGSVSVQDLFAFLGAWFNFLPSADFNHSGAVSIQDIWEFLGAWFGPC